MEQITYRITLDVHKNGIQRTLQGFVIGDNKSRRISVNLTAKSDTYEIPYDHVTALMYVTRPTDSEPSINACTIEDNTIIYDVLPSDMALEGITEMQIKLIEGDVDGARKVLHSPKFAIEITEGTNDEGAEETTSFTALENAVAQAKEVYDSRLVSIEITTDCLFRAYYADGSVYENDSLKAVLNTGSILLAESYAHGGTGIREGEDADNAMYYKDMAEKVHGQTLEVHENCKDIMDVVVDKSVYTSFSVNFETGEVVYLSQNYIFNINEETGNLEFEGVGEWTPTDATKEALASLVSDLTATINDLQSRVSALEEK